MEKDEQIAWGYTTENVELKHRGSRTERETRGKIQRGYGGQREELKTEDREVNRERRRSQGVAVGAGRRGRN